jgi:hypothetical protein
METPERSLMPFEFLLLFFVKMGFGTPYAIMNHAGIPSGASSPTLKRLEQKRFVIATPGSRRSISYSVTKQGNARLLKGLEVGPRVYGRLTSRGIFESLPRLLFFGLLKGNPAEAQEALRKTEFDLSMRAQKSRAIARECRQILERPLEGDNRESAAEQIAVCYRLLGAATDSVQMDLQIQALPRLLSLIDELKPALESVFYSVLTNLRAIE